MTADTPIRCEPPSELQGVDGWHWVKCGDDGKEFITRRSAAPQSGLEPLWARYGESATPIWASAHWDWRYIAPVATPAEVEALRAERDQVAKFLMDRAPDIGAGTDPVGFLMASYVYVTDERDALRAEIANAADALAQMMGALCCASMEAAVSQYDAQIANKKRAEMAERLAYFKGPWDGDQPLPEDTAIAAAQPWVSADPKAAKRYAAAMRLVGARRGKSSLVELVTWLLAERDKALSAVEDVKLVMFADGGGGCPGD